MTKLKIVAYPNPILERVCQPVKRFDAKLAQLLDDLFDTMMDADGIGIAAPQVGVDLQAAIVYLDDETDLIELINPKVLETAGENSDVEGCLSFPGVYGYVTRPDFCKIQAQDRHGKTFTYEAEGYLARALLHEIDHLNGIVFEKKITERISETELAEMNAKEIRIVFMGTPDFSVPILERLIAEGYQVVAVVTQPDRPVGRKRILTPPPVKVAALAHGIPVLQPEKIREPAELEKVFAFEPDLVVTAAFGQILPKALLDYPRLGCINVHASLLPKLRCGAPIHYALMQGHTEAGVTIMYMVERLDAGDMLAKAAIPIEETDHTGILHEKLSKVGAQLLIETLPKLVNDDLQPEAQNDKEATFARNISREEEKLDWSRSGEEIYNQIRGLHPWPVAFTTIQDHVVKVWWGEKVVSDSNATPGTILALMEDGILVQTGNKTAIKLTDLQLAGKKRMLVKEILRGAHPFQIGELFK